MMQACNALMVILSRRYSLGQQIPTLACTKIGKDVHLSGRQAVGIKESWFCAIHQVEPGSKRQHVEWNPSRSLDHHTTDME